MFPGLMRYLWRELTCNPTSLTFCRAPKSGQLMRHRIMSPDIDFPVGTTPQPVTVQRKFRPHSVQDPTIGRQDGRQLVDFR